MGKMKILLAMRGIDTERWISALETRLPEAQLRVWTSGDSGPADYLLYWKEDVAALAPRDDLKLIFNMGAGVDALIDILRTSQRPLAHEVPIIRLEDAGMSQQMVQYALYCTLRSQRRFHEYETLARGGHWEPLDAHEPEQFVVGVLGAGKLGLPVAKAIESLGYPVRLYSRTMKEVGGIETYAGPEQFESFVNGARLLINLLPNTPETEGILNGRVFEKMAKPGYIVNLARGTHLVEKDLIQAIKEGNVERAYLDVFCEEPLPKSHPFWRQPGIEITPHISARTRIEESAAQVVEKIAMHQRGVALDQVDLSLGY